MSARICAAPVVLAGLALLACGASASAQVTQVAKLHAADGAVEDEFGYSVALSGDVAFIGAPGDDEAAQEAGAVYVFEKKAAGWTQVQKLTAPDSLINQFLGFAVARSGNVSVATSGVYGSFRPAVIHVYGKVGGAWTEVQALEPSDGALGIGFGMRVALSGDLIATGAASDPLAGQFSGSAYVYRRLGDTWVPAAKLVPADGAPFDAFGTAVAIAGGDVFVGAPEDDDAANNAGTVSVYREVRGQWSLVQKLLASDAESGDRFGRSVAASGAVLVVGALTDGPPENGSVYVFERQGEQWVQVAKLLSSDGHPDDGFSLELAVAGDIVLSGAPFGSNAAGVPSGAMYVYSKVAGTWGQVAKVTAADGDASDQFGRSLSLASDRALVGVWPDGDLGKDSGSAYVLDLGLLPTFTDLGHALAGVGGEPQLVAEGTLEAGTPIGFLLADAPPLASSMFIAGWSALFAPFKGGTLVPFPVFLVPVTTSALGKAAVLGTWPAGIPADTLTYFQWWIVDAAGPAGFAASNALLGLAP